MDPAVGAYELLDAGDGRRLERFGQVVLDRPAPGAAGSAREATRLSGLRRARGSSAGPGRPRVRGCRRRGSRSSGPWSSMASRLELRPTPAGQVGFFPEHRDVALWAADQAVAAGRSPAAPGHGPQPLRLHRPRDARSWPASERPWCTSTPRGPPSPGRAGTPPSPGWRTGRSAGSSRTRCASSTREARRGRRYDGVVLDPPTYGHGPGGAAWRLEDDLGPLLAGDRVASWRAAGFVACTAHSTGLAPELLAGLVRDGLGLSAAVSPRRELRSRRDERRAACDRMGRPARRA